MRGQTDLVNLAAAGSGNATGLENYKLSLMRR